MFFPFFQQSKSTKMPHRETQKSKCDYLTNWIDLDTECNFSAMLTRREASTPRRSRGVLASLRVNIAEESVVKAPSTTSAQCWRGGRQVHRGEAEVYLPPSESTLQRSRPSPPPPAVGLMISTPIASKVHCSRNGFENSSFVTELE